MAQDPAPPPSGSAPLKKDLDRDVTMHYLDKVHDAFTTNRTYANRVLIIQTVIALVVVGVVIGAAEGEEFTLGSSNFSLDVWAVLVAGGVFVALTPGFVIGRLIYNADLAKEMQGLYARLERGLAEHPDDTAVTWETMPPWEIAPLLTEAGWAFARLVPWLRRRVGRWIGKGARNQQPKPDGSGGPANGKDPGDEWPSGNTTAGLAMLADFVGGPLTFLVLFAVLPVGAQVSAGVWCIHTVESTCWEWAVGIATAAVALMTVLSVFGAIRRLVKRWSEAGELDPVRRGTTA